MEFYAVADKDAYINGLEYFLYRSDAIKYEKEIGGVLSTEVIDSDTVDVYVAIPNEIYGCGWTHHNTFEDARGYVESCSDDFIIEHWHIPSGIVTRM